MSKFHIDKKSELVIMRQNTSRNPLSYHDKIGIYASIDGDYKWIVWLTDDEAEILNKSGFTDYSGTYYDRIQSN